MRLEDHVASLNRRRDHLLAVNARLSVPLTLQPNPVAFTGNTNSFVDRATAGNHQSISIRPRESKKGQVVWFITIF